MAQSQRPRLVPNNQEGVTLFEREMRKAVEERFEEIDRQVCMGTDIVDFASYRHMTGYIKAYMEVLDIMASVRDRLNKLERS